MTGSDLKDNSPHHASIDDSVTSSVVDDEVLRYKIRTLIEEKPPQPLWHTLSTNASFVVILGFILTGLAGGFLTHYYNLKQEELQARSTKELRESDRLREDQQRESDRKREDEKRVSDRLREEQERESDRVYQERQREIERQRALQQRESERLRDERQKTLEYQRNLQLQELVRERSFSDELNKMRIQRIGEVWETIDKTEADLDDILDRANRESSLELFNPKTNEYVDRIISLVRDEKTTIAKNRFWLGDRIYNQIRVYLDINGKYTIDKLIGKSGVDLSDIVKRREMAKQDITQIRSMFLSGEMISGRRGR